MIEKVFLAEIVRSESRLSAEDVWLDGLHYAWFLFYSYRVIEFEMCLEEECRVVPLCTGTVT